MLTPEEKKQYHRHLILSDFGEEAQLALKNSKVLVVGAGGLGCPVLQYITAAGVGHIGVIDGDDVETSNLQRQVLFTYEDIGENKARIAVRRLKMLNPYIRFTTYEENLTAQNALDLFNQYDYIVDGSDNFPTRYLCNDASVVTKKPLIFGSIYKFQGQIAVFNMNGSASYRCLYPNPPNDGEVPNCSEIGVLGILPGIIGIQMASELIKVVIGKGEILKNKIKVIDVLNQTDMILSIIPQEQFIKISELQDNYQNICNKDNMNNTEIDQKSPKEVLQLLNDSEVILLDVREPFEQEICKIENSISMPLNTITANYETLSKDKAIVCICHHGMRSMHAAMFLKEKGFDKLINLSGGIHQWALDVDSEMATY